MNKTSLNLHIKETYFSKCQGTKSRTEGYPPGLPQTWSPTGRHHTAPGEATHMRPTRPPRNLYVFCPPQNPANQEAGVWSLSLNCLPLVGEIILLELWPEVLTILILDCLLMGACGVKSPRNQRILIVFPSCKRQVCLLSNIMKITAFSGAKGRQAYCLL